jgi:hypothetical protein
MNPPDSRNRVAQPPSAVFILISGAEAGRRVRRGGRYAKPEAMSHEHKPHPRLWLAGVVLLAALVRLGFWLATDHVLDGEENFRLLFAIDPLPFNYPMVGPLHLYMLRALILLTGAPLVVGPLLSMVFGVGVVALGGLLAARLYGRWAAGLFTALLLALHWPQVQYATLAKVEPIFAFFVLAALWFITGRPRDRWRLVAAGFCLTIAGGLRYEIWVLLPVFALGAAYRPGGKFRLADALAIGVPSAVFPAFWLGFFWFFWGDPLHGFKLIADSGAGMLFYPDRWIAACGGAITPAFAAAVVLGAVVRRPRWPAALGLLVWAVVTVAILRGGLPETDIKYLIAPLVLFSLAAGAGLAWLPERRHAPWGHLLLGAALLLFVAHNALALYHAAARQQEPPGFDRLESWFVDRDISPWEIASLPEADAWSGYLRLRLLARDPAALDTPRDRPIRYFFGREDLGSRHCPSGVLPEPLPPWFICEPAP